MRSPPRPAESRLSGPSQATEQTASPTRGAASSDLRSDRQREVPVLSPQHPEVNVADEKKDESAADVLSRLGDDAAKWAAEFRKTAIALGYSDMDEGWLIGWFANAIVHSADVRRWRAEAEASR